MNRYRMQFAPRVWKPRLNPLVVRMLRPLRIRQQRNKQRLQQVEVRGKHHLEQLLDDGAGVLLMPNHSSHADPFAIYSAADEIPVALYVMATWHVFQDQPRMIQWLLQGHGCFSVDREANDLAAFKEAVGILKSKPQPLVVFPEGEIYHCNERVTPFREGAAAIAIAAAKRAERKIFCVPCAMVYRYLSDPISVLTESIGRLEEAIFWRRQEARSLPDRIYHFAEALLALKELEYFRQAQPGELRDRIARLGDFVLTTVEQRRGITNASGSIPERVKAIRRHILERLAAGQLDSDEQAKQLHVDLEDVFLVVQSFSYPGDYVSQKPTWERMAETIDKLEEDVLQLPTATIRGDRKVVVEFGEPIEVSTNRQAKVSAGELTRQVEQAVQQMLDLAIG
jgi:hypothetical protein